MREMDDPVYNRICQKGYTHPYRVYSAERLTAPLKRTGERGSGSWEQISWEEAIDAHVSGLARGYGYTISVAGAKKYCPPNWFNWYNNTLSEMNRI